MIKVKNNKETTDTWSGMMIDSDTYYTLEQSEYNKWQNDSKVLIDIATGDLVVNNGTDDILDIANAINHLKQVIPEARNAIGEIIVAPTFEDIGDLTTIWKCALHTAPANSLSFFDQAVTTQHKLREGWFKIISGGTIGDYIECSVIDKDDVLGLFSAFNLTLGVDILELKKYIRTEYISPDDKTRQPFNSNAVSELMSGLYIRVAYLNIGDSEAIFTVTKKYHEA